MPDPRAMRRPAGLCGCGWVAIIRVYRWRRSPGCGSGRDGRSCLWRAPRGCVACGTDDRSDSAPAADTEDVGSHDAASPDDAGAAPGTDAASVGDAAADAGSGDAGPTLPAEIGPDDDLDGDGTVNRDDWDDDGDGLSDDAEQRADTENVGCVWLVDCDGDGLPDRMDGMDDTDGDGTPNLLDLDSDGDGVPDAEQFRGIMCEVLRYGALHAGDADDDGVPNAIEGVVDADGAGASDLCDTDSDDDGLRDGDEVDWSSEEFPVDLDTDGDGTVDRRDLDSDGDGVPDEVEHAQTGRAGWFMAEGYLDPDEDGLLPWRDTDSDGDGRPDAASYLDNGRGGGSMQDLDGDYNPDFVDLDDDGDELHDIYETGCPEAPAHDNPDSDGDGWEDFWEASFGLPMTAGCDPEVSPGDLGVERVLPRESTGQNPPLRMTAEGLGEAWGGERDERVVRTWPEQLDPACIVERMEWSPSSDTPCEGAGLVDTDGDEVVDAAVGYREGDTLTFTVPSDAQYQCIGDVPRVKNGIPEIIIAALEVDLLADGEVVATWRWAIESEQWF